jgi:hypothetical protein
MVCFSAQTDVLLYAIKNWPSLYPTQHSRQRLWRFFFTGLMRRIWLLTYLRASSKCLEIWLRSSTCLQDVCVIKAWDIHRQSIALRHMLHQTLSSICSWHLLGDLRKVFLTFWDCQLFYSQGHPLHKLCIYSVLFFHFKQTKKEVTQANDLQIKHQLILFQKLRLFT